MLGCMQVLWRVEVLPWQDRRQGQPLHQLFAPQACGPTVQQTCKENTYVKGMCFLFGSNLMRPPQQFPKALRGTSFRAET